jgi:hypothetical protein
MSSKRQDAITELLARLAGIQAVNGYQTNAGLKIFENETPALGPDDEPVALALMIQDDRPGYQGERVQIALPVRIEGHASISTDGPWLAAEAVVADIKKAVETDHDLSRTLIDRGLERGTTALLKRADGSTTVGFAVEYVLNFSEPWGAP